MPHKNDAAAYALLQISTKFRKKNSLDYYKLSLEYDNLKSSLELQEVLLNREHQHFMPLHFAIQHNSETCGLFLLENYYEFTKTLNDGTGRNILHLACENLNLVFIKSILERYSNICQTSTSSSANFSAISLIKYVNLKNAKGETPLHIIGSREMLSNGTTKSKDLAISSAKIRKANSKNGPPEAQKLRQTKISDDRKKECAQILESFGADTSIPTPRNQDYKVNEDGKVVNNLNIYGINQGGVQSRRDYISRVIDKPYRVDDE